MPVSLIVLAAGQGTRMNSDLPKVLHRLGAAPILHHALAAGRVLDPERIVVVAGHGAADVAKAARGFDDRVEIVEQAEQLGTGHAVAQAVPLLAGATGDVIVLYGDTPFVRSETLEAMLAARAAHSVVVLGFEAADPGRYGRLVTRGEGLERIVEWKDATPEERAITLCNSGVICASSELMRDLVGQIGNRNAAGEYYLTDIVGLARAAGHSAGVVLCDEAETLGINTRAELARAESAFQSRMRSLALEEGVTLTAPDTVFFALDTFIGRDAVIGPNVVFGPGVTIESGAEIRAFCHLEGCHVSRGATVGPFARLRPGAELAEDVHVGNFVEIKNAVLDEGVKVGHLTYLGDAHIGEQTNIGAGTVTCNYDGVMKHRTEIGARAFIGSNTMLVAPVTIGRDAMTASGSVISQDVPAVALA
ncbi:MAG: bifunctional UDP-N-acetylglucosamine diphosphorylase/glucosamine-1-phosphate N-acetyltransferase GlmU, partial [Pseudorhodobacter sp.]